MNYARYFLVLVLLGMNLHVVYGQSSKQMVAEFDRLLSETYKADGPGCAALVAVKGQVVYEKAFGMANLELGVAMRPEMVFRIGSVTKQFTAVAILKLMEEGKLGLQDEITKYIPDYPTHGHKITIEHLLTHTSGIKSYTDMGTFGEIERKDMKPEELVDFFKSQPMDFAPGTDWNYSNSGYFLLGVIVEKVSGMSYPEYVETQFFKPLGMTRSYYGSDSKLIPNRASGYQKGPDGIVNADMMSMTLPYAAGSIQSTVGDLYKWHQGLHSGKVVKKETLEKAFVEYKLPDGRPTQYGYGWVIGLLQGSVTIEHGGGINGFLTNVIYLPKEDVFVAVFSNSTGTPPAPVSQRMGAYAIGKPAPSKKIAVDAQVLAGYVGVYEDSSGANRIITLEGGQLSSQRSGGRIFPINAYEKDKFFFDHAFTTLHFQRDGSGKVVAVHALDGPKVTVWKLTDKGVPSKEERKLPEALLAQYVGDFQMAPQFVFTITKEGDRLFLQATGQDKLELFASREDHFFVKEVDAQIEFVKDDAGKYNTAVLNQGGQKLVGPRIK